MIQVRPHTHGSPIILQSRAGVNWKIEVLSASGLTAAHEHRSWR
jgi:hypothetical protein